MRLSSLASIGFCANMAIDQCKKCTLTLDELDAASDSGHLVDLLQISIDDSGAIALWAQNEVEKNEVEKALSNAFETIRGREKRKCGVGDNVLCVVVAMALEAIQQSFSR